MPSWLGAKRITFLIFLKNSAGFSISCEVAELRMPFSSRAIFHLLIPSSVSSSPAQKAGANQTPQRETDGELDEPIMVATAKALPAYSQATKSETCCSAGSKYG